MRYRFVIVAVIPVVALATALFGAGIGEGLGQDEGAATVATTTSGTSSDGDWVKFGISEEDFEALRQTALDYGEGFYEGDAERMERAVHPDLAKRVLMPSPRTGRGEIQHMSGLTIVQMTRSGSGKRTPVAERRTDFTLLDITGKAACVKFVMHDWVDYLQMSKVNGRWVIVNVLWEFKADAKQRYGFPEDY